MIALVYLGVMVWFGDAVARRWFAFTSWPHRLATAFLVGLLLGTWLSYLIGVMAGSTSDPMSISALGSIWGMGIAALWLRRRTPSAAIDSRGLLRSNRTEWLLVLALLAVVGWMMTATYSLAADQLRIAGDLWSDFGPTSAISQSFALGHNFPTEYPHFAGEPIRYHFLYYFQVGNLTYLGLDPAAANNILSIPSVVAMLVVLEALGERLFRSRLVGWLGAGLFFFLGALSFIPYLGSFPSIADALAALPNLDHFLSSGFPYRGEEWGIWTQDVFLNQRHLASAIGILLVIVLFLLNRLEHPAATPVAGEPAGRSGWARATRSAIDERRRQVGLVLREPATSVRAWVTDPALPGYALCGLLAGLLPLYNGAMFIASAVVLGVLFVVFPNRTRMLVLAVAAGVVALPQLLFLRPGTMAGHQTYPSFFWGYVVDDPTLVRVATYVAFIFGPKLILSAVALLLGTWEQRRVFLAFLAVAAVAFLAQFSVEVLANHKFIQTWLIVANLFVAYGVIRLWRARSMIRTATRLVAVGLTAVIVVGGAIDLVPIKNERIYTVGVDGDPLYEWVRAETSPKAVFLTDLFVVHGILIAGRKVYLGWPYYAWSAGYDTFAREAWYRDLFALRSPRELLTRLQAARIDYVAIDDGLRDRGEAPRVNEDLYRSHFETVFTDSGNRYGHLVIYRVPADPGAAADLPEAAPEDMYVGGPGPSPGQFDGPHGLARDPSSGDLLVADTGNGRISRYSSNGDLVGSFALPGSAGGSTSEPYGVAVDSSGHVYVAAVDRLLEYDATGTLVKDWGEADGRPFNLLEDVATDRDGRVFALDSGNGRIVEVEPDGSITAWGAIGDGDGGLDHPTGLAVNGDTVVVADAGNARVVEFDRDGTYLDALPMPDWQAGIDAGTLPFADVAINDAGTIWASSPTTNSIIVFRPDGTQAGVLTPAGDDQLDQPSGLALQPGGALFVANLGSNRITLLTQPNP
jgi:DNA-binding beta-propeller fold protein YncE